MRYLRLLAHVRRNPSGVLLLVQLGGLVLYPFLEKTAHGQNALAIFGIVVLVVATRMVQRTPWLTWVSAGLSVVIVALLALQQLFGVQGLVPWIAGIEALFYFYAAGSLIAYMMGDRHPTADELFCAGATFTLLAWAFTNLFILCQALQPGSIAAAVNTGGTRTWTELMYLSFALLSSTGIGDVIPLTVHARAIAMLEMFVGVMYLATVVSRLIGLTLVHRR